MVDAQSNIKVSIDTADALASIKNLQKQISTFHQSMAKSGAAANAVTNQMQQNLINSINATGQFSAQMKTIRTSTESFTNSLEKNKFSLGEYFRYAGGASKTFGKLFKTEFETINKVARENVKDLQTQYIKLGRDANGAMKSIAVRPLALDMKDLSTQTMIASQKQALLNQLLKQGSTNLLNFGKNTQWAGRQLMVGFTLPLLTLGSAASKTFMDLEAQAIRFKKVYGDLFTAPGDSQAALDSIKELGKEFTKYGVALSDTVGLASEAAAAGFEGVDLQRQTTAATRLSILGQIDNQKALETTISLQNAFSMSSDKLAESIDFLNAVENQTVVSLDDITTAIPKVAPVIQQLGGDVKDLAFFMTAMKEGGINASEGANALKSGLASMINPTGKAVDMLSSFGINIKAIVQDNKGDLKKTVVEFATALNQLDPLNRAQAIEQMFGKFQFARLSTLFANVAKDGNQAARVLDLANSSVQDLAALSEKELGLTAESSMVKFKAAVENLKITLIPLGEEFLKAVTPILGFISNILDKFNNLGDGTKKAIVIITGAVAGLGPILLMTFGLLANGVANIIKGFTFLKSVFNKTGSATHLLGTQVEYMTLEQRNALAVGASLDQVHNNLAQTFSSERAAVDALTKAYQRSVAAQSQFMPTAVPIGRGPIKKRARGKPAVVGGTGNRDSELALLMPGETVIPTAMSKKYGSLINGMIADNIPGYMAGKVSTTVASHIEGLTPAQLAATLSDPVMQQVLESLPDVKIGLQALSTTTDGMVTVSETIETSLRGLSSALSENNIKDATAVGTGGFAGTTIEASSERNLMLNAANIAGDPITFEQMQAASGKAQSYLDKPVKNETAAVKAQREEAQKLIQEQLEFEKSLTGLSEQDVEVRKTDFTKRKTTQALEYSLMQKGLSASEASTLAKQQIANAEKSTLKLVQGAKTDLEKRKIKEAAYQATLLKEMGLVAGYDEKNTKTTVFNKTQLNAVPRDMAKGQMQFGTPYKPGQEVPSDAAVFGSGKSFMGLSGRRVKRNQSAVVDASIRDDYYSDRARAKNNFKEGSNNAKAYRKGVQAAKIPDIYEESRKRKSPHPLAPKDGKDDARAYNKARDKELTQSGKKRRVSQRPQGPAPIGPIIPVGTQELTIIPKPTKGELRKDRMRKTSTKLLGKAKSTGRLGGGMGLLGASMAAQMLPESPAAAIAQTTLQFAAMGAMFGPWGAAAGAAFGLVSSAISALDEKQRKYKEMTESVFKSSAASAKFFGNEVVDVSAKVTSLNLTLVGTDGKLKRVTEEAKTSTQSLASFKQMLEGLGKEDPLAQLMAGLKEEDNPKKIYELASAFVAMQVATGQVKVDQADAFLNLILKASDNANMAGTNMLNFASQADAVIPVLESLKKKLEEVKTGQADFYATNVLVGETLIQLASSLSNLSSYQALKEALDNIKNSGLDAATALTLVRDAYQESGETEQANLVRNIMQIEGADVSTVFAVQQAYLRGLTIHLGKKTTLASLEKELEEGYKKAGASAFKRSQTMDKATEKQIAQNTKQVAGLEKRSKALDAILKKEESIADSYKKQNDFLNKQADLDQKIAEAKMAGNYLEANNLEQQKLQNQAEFANEARLEKLRAEKEKLDNKITEIKNNTGALQANSKKLDGLSTTILNWKPGKIITEEDDRPGTTTNFQEPKVEELSDGGTTYMGFLNDKGEKVQYKINPKDNPDKASMLFDLLVSKGYSFTGYGKVGIKGYETQHAPLWEKLTRGLLKLLNVPGYAAGGQIKQFKPGGSVTGPGTATSDSIPAYLSNGEYVVKASSVAKYGTGFMDSVNAGKYASGGLAMPNVLGKGMDWLGKTLFSSGNSLIKGLLGFDITKPFSQKSGMEKFSMASMLVPGSSGAKAGIKAAKLADTEALKYFVSRGFYDEHSIDLVDQVMAATVKGNKKNVKGMSLIEHDPLGISTLQGLFSNTGPRATKDMLGLSLMLGAKESGTTKTGIALAASADRSMYSEALVKGLERRGLGNVIGLPEKDLVTAFGNSNSKALSARNKTLKNLSNDKLVMDNAIEIPELALNASREALSKLLTTGYNQSEFKQLLSVFNKSMKNSGPGFANGGLVTLPKFHDWNGPVPGSYGQELPAILKSGTEGVYQNSYISKLKNDGINSNSSNSNTVYNIDMTINGGNANANDIAEQVMKKIKTISSQNNKSNKVSF